MSSKRKDPINTLGGKSQIINEICKVVEYAIEEYDLVGAADYFMGGCRLFLHLDPGKDLELKVANEVDRGFVGFFQCLKDAYLTDQLIEMIWLLADQYASKEKFKEAKELRLKEDTPIVLSAALTYIVVEYSRAADRQNFIEQNTYKGIKPKSLLKFLHLYGVLEGVEFTCGDYINQFNKYKERADIIIWIDPPYVKTDEGKTKKTAGYFHDFTLKDQEKLIDNLIATKNKVVLNGYENALYLRLIENGFQKHFIGLVNVPSSGKAQKVKEYIWCNFEIPEYLLPEKPFDVE
jgi:DNA adenine methylase